MRKQIKFRWSERKDAVENAKAVLPKLVKEYLAMGRKAANGKGSEEDLHQFRLATKRFRYTLEIFAPLYGPGLERWLKRLRAVQDALGEVQDCHAVGSMSALKKHRPMQEWLKRQSEKKTVAFQRLWAREFGGLSTERNWLAYLQRYAREKTRS